ncbi:MAG: hypothetical protein LBI56_04465 [Puniceicoccales bacterium]|jgi:hypothetical protein|nr:hypothetical protein [Puniceicoccales bacterium]
MTDIEQCNSEARKIGDFSRKNSNDFSEYFSRIRGLRVSQLEEVMPASLPLAVIFRGMLCTCSKMCKKYAGQTLPMLGEKDLVVQMGKCEFPDGPRLVDNFLPKAAENYV